ncbi:MAG: Fe-S protein assembly chaperone HscA [Myxococcales bacterium]|nr:Fe-S protein assembly chaperone HscA [Myxococcota bacterium]MDW8284125.1 Fe-S protein assembly chaperone HscA [Myxococcales bacterium]
MSLLQIAEPGESRARQACHGRVVGIDLGTTHSLVACVRDGQPVCLPGPDGEVLLPSVVHYRSSGPPLVGAEAAAMAHLAPYDTIASVKRLMGRGLHDVMGKCPYRLNERSESVVRLRVAGGREVTPVEVSAEILRVLRQRAEQALGGELAGAVITVPAYFDDAQRQATKDAGRLAGLEVLRLLNEPTAAALAYGLDRRREGRFAVFDLGGGTFDISILDLRDGIFTVLATAGDTALGGDDMDRALVELICARHPGGAAFAASVEADPGLARHLLLQARQVKHRLSSEELVRITPVGGEGEVQISRADFEQAIAPLLQRTTLPCRRALKDAGLTAADLDGVVLVGGATRVPALRRHVAELFGRPPLCDLDPDQVVALGAAAQAEIIYSERNDMLLVDVTPLSLGLELMGGIVEKIIPRNSRVPTRARQVFTTYADGQTGFDLHVVQGERETAADCRSLARFQLRGIPPAAAGVARLEVTFLIDENGLLHVTAREQTSGKEASIQVKPSYGLTEEEIERMLLDSYEHGAEDVARRQLLEQRVEADRILNALRAALAADGHLLEPAERARLDEAAAALAAAREGQDHRLIAERIQALDRASQEFAQRRMDQSLSRAVAGRSLHDVERAVHLQEPATEGEPCPG